MVIRALECIQSAFTYKELMETAVKEEKTQQESQTVKIEVINNRKASEDEFQAKVNQELNGNAS